MKTRLESVLGRGPWAGVRGLLAAPALLGLSLVGSGCIVTAPEPGEVWEAWRDGLQSPLATFEAFRTALRGDLLEAEYRCFGSGWKARNGVSQVCYREFRDALLAEEPLLRWALSRAETTLDPASGPFEAVVWATWSDLRVGFRMRREAYMEVRAEGRRVVSEPLDTLSQQLSLDPQQGLLFGWVPVTADLDPEQVEAMTLASEWRIDDLVVTRLP